MSLRERQGLACGTRLKGSREAEPSRAVLHPQTTSIPTPPSCESTLTAVRRQSHNLDQMQTNPAGQ